MDIKDLVEESGYTPKRKAGTHGGEYGSPCPFCQDGDDRFLIWPARHNANGEYVGGRYSCRVCGRYGDAINFLRCLYGLSYQDACEQLRIPPKERNNTRARPPKPKLEFFPVEDPPPQWVEKAVAFVDWCHAGLMKHPAALDAVKARGFTFESIQRFRFGFCSKEFFREYEDWGLEPEMKDNGKLRRLWLPAGFVIPTFGNDGRPHKVKIRRSEWSPQDKYPKYVEVSGSKQCPAIYGDSALPAALILESEFDALLCQQEVSNLAYCVAIGGSTKPLDLYTHELLARTPKLLFCPDFDKAGAVAWNLWKKMFPEIQRILTPYEKSAGDAFLAGLNLRDWIDEHLNEVFDEL